MKLRFHVALLVVVGCMMAVVDLHAQSSGPWQTYGTQNGEWRSYAGNIAGQKYSPLDEIDEENFDELAVQWVWSSVDHYLSRSTAAGGEWYAPLETIVESLVADTPTLYRNGQSPNPSRLQATPQCQRAPWPPPPARSSERHP